MKGGGEKEEAGGMTEIARESRSEKSLELYTSGHEASVRRTYFEGS
jgi:hypothetical protein